MSFAQPGSAHISPVDNETPDETPFTTDPNAKLLHLPRLSTRLSKQNTRAPNPNSGNLTQLTVLTPENFTLLSSSVNSTSEIVQICFQTIQLQSIIFCPS